MSQYALSNILYFGMIIISFILAKTIMHFIIKDVERGEQNDR